MNCGLFKHNIDYLVCLLSSAIISDIAEKSLCAKFFSLYLILFPWDGFPEVGWLDKGV